MFPVYRKWFLLLVAVVILAMILACGSSSTSNTEKPTAVPVGESTKVPEVLPTEAPTNTPAPTDTPTPTDTPAPTNTPEPPPEPIKLSGKGDSVVKIDYPFDEAMMHIIGNPDASFFNVTLYDDNNVPDMLVNTTDSYDGIRLLGRGLGDKPTIMEVKATGEWTAEILPISLARHLVVPGKIAGNGDEVVTLEGKASIIKIKGNDNASYFGVTGYGGLLPDLLVNTTDPYEGTSRVQAGTRTLSIQASGPWEIEVE